MLKNAAKSAINYVLAVVAPIVWFFGRDKLVVLTYHRVLPRSVVVDHSIEPGMFVYEETFNMHLNTIKKYFQIVDLADWLKADQKPAKLCCAITFDDGWRDNYHYAFPLLREHQVPATIFLVSSLVDTNSRFWPDRLGSVLARSSTVSQAADESDDSTAWLMNLKREACFSESNVTRENVSRAIKVAKCMDVLEVERHLERLEQMAFSKVDDAGPDLLAWDQINEMIASGIVTVGSHTRKHTRLIDNISDPDLLSEIVESKREIENSTKTSVRVFCYPNGDKTAAAEKLVRQNYQAACTTAKRWNSDKTDDFDIGRITMHEDGSKSRHSLIATLTGIF